MRALVLSGGGSHAAWQVGVLSRLALDPANRYEIISGTSAGAINAAHLAMYPTLFRGVDTLNELWKGLDNSKIHRNHLPFGPISALWRLSLKNTSPLRTLVNERLSRQKILDNGRKLRLSAVNLRTSELKHFDEHYPKLASAILASAACPIFMEPVEIDGDLWVDGGVREVTPLASVIEAGATAIDVIVADPVVPTAGENPKNVFDLGLRVFTAMMAEIMQNDLRHCERINFEVSRGHSNKRVVALRVFIPARPHRHGAMDFSNAAVKEMIAMGFEESGLILAKEKIIP